MINALYDASEAGVHIDLIVRGINCLVPNHPYSRNIRMIRIIDSYLEHARIWYFYAGGHEDMYLSSADWMRRNLNRRIETAVPIFDQSIKNEILSIISLQLQCQGLLYRRKFRKSLCSKSGSKAPFSTTLLSSVRKIFYSRHSVCDTRNFYQLIGIY